MTDRRSCGWAASSAEQHRPGQDRLDVLLQGGVEERRAGLEHAPDRVAPGRGRGILVPVQHPQLGTHEYLGQARHRRVSGVGQAGRGGGRETELERLMETAFGRLLAEAVQEPCCECRAAGAPEVVAEEGTERQQSGNAHVRGRPDRSRS